MVDDLLVSVIIPTYNRVETIERAIRSVLSQTHGNIEVLVVDDCSSDSTADVISSIADSRIHYVRHERNMGVSAARNTGLELARGFWVSFLDSDDWWRPDKLEIQLGVADRSTLPNVGVILCGMERRKSVGTDYLTPEVRGNVYHKLLGRGITFLSGPTGYLIRRENGHPGARFHEDISYAEDWDYLLQVALNHNFDSTPQPFVVVEQSHGMPRLSEADMATRYEAYEQVVSRQSHAYTNTTVDVSVGYVGLAIRSSASDFGRTRAYLKKATENHRYSLSGWVLRIAAAGGSIPFRFCRRVLHSAGMLS